VPGKWVASITGGCEFKNDRRVRIRKKFSAPARGAVRENDLRHSAVAILTAQGVDARSISGLVGHSSVPFTLQVYGYLTEETKRETAIKMDSALASPKPVAPSLAPLVPAENVH